MALKPSWGSQRGRLPREHVGWVEGRTPESLAELHAWVRERLRLPKLREAELWAAIDSVVRAQQRQWEESKEAALEALRDGFGARAERLQQEINAKDETVSNIARYFEEVVAELTERSRRDPKTKLLNFSWFLERLESFLAVEQRVRWCGIGVVDITSFKWYNDNLGHGVGDRIIGRVADILAEQIRSDDLLAVEPEPARKDLHARFGGDEFCFLIPSLPDRESGCAIAERFKKAVERFDWDAEDARLAERPVRVDVGVVCLRLGPIAERRGLSRQLATELLNEADQLMYSAKGCGARHVYVTEVALERGRLVQLASPDQPPAAREPDA